MPSHLIQGNTNICVDQSRVPKREETVDENGIITVVEYGTNDEGKKVKVCVSKDQNVIYVKVRFIKNR